MGFGSRANGGLTKVQNVPPVRIKYKNGHKNRTKPVVTRVYMFILVFILTLIISFECFYHYGHRHPIR